jgi:putative Mn2+ efflux pump MntP
MGFWELLAIAVGLSMDAFAIAVCKGLSVRKLKIKHILTVGIYFGGFQALMPIIGYYLGEQFESMIKSFDHWIVLALLSLIGINMIRESFKSTEKLNDSFSLREMLPLAFATSIDALAVGITFAFLGVKIFSAVAFIGAVTFCLAMAGITMGNAFGAKYKSKAEFIGGIVLILMGIKILLEHLGVIGS